MLVTPLHFGSSISSLLSAMPAASRGWDDRLWVFSVIEWSFRQLNPLVKRVQVLSNIAAFPTETKVVIISNEPEHLRIALGDFEVEVCGGHDNLSHPYQLPWSSRRIMEAAYHGGRTADTCCKCWHSRLPSRLRTAWMITASIPAYGSQTSCKWGRIPYRN